MKETSSNPVTLRGVEMLPRTHVDEIERGERFAFGENWQRFLGTLDETRIHQAEDSLKTMLSVDDLRGRDFIDVGSGSGIFSLAARRLGARVISFDFDPQSVACTKEMKRRFFPDDKQWSIQEGSVLDTKYLNSLGTFDVVYSWGVLHHTGKMWEALDNVAQLVKPGGQLFIAIYNDVGWRSVAWRGIKASYNKMPRVFKTPFVLSILIPGQVKAAVQSAFQLRFREFVKSWTEYEKNRGMSRWHDAVDWIGGYPYEVASTASLEQFYRQRGFSLKKAMAPDYKLGCNELVLVRES
jgi:2-polyprenyl-3-methyl-5-hydroxy-6-metoxy-1,4-benzoquinol methylase